MIGTRRWAFAAASVVFASFSPTASAQRDPVQIAQTPPVLATAQFGAAPDLRCDLLEVKRLSGGALSVRWKITNGAGVASGLTAGTGKQIRYTFHWNEIYFIDPAENKKYQVLKDSADNWIGSVSDGDIPPGEQRLSWVKFPAPPANSSKISISISGFAPFEDIPISQ